MARRKLTDKQAHEVCRLLSEGYKNFQISEMLDIDKFTVSRIRRKVIYKKISDKYDYVL